MSGCVNASGTGRTTFAFLYIPLIPLPSPLPSFHSCPYYDMLTPGACDETLAQGTPAKFVPVEEGSELPEYLWFLVKPIAWKE